MSNLDFIDPARTLVPSIPYTIKLPRKDVRPKGCLISDDGLHLYVSCTQGISFAIDTMTFSVIDEAVAATNGTCEERVVVNFGDHLVSLKVCGKSLIGDDLQFHFPHTITQASAHPHVPKIACTSTDRIARVYQLGADGQAELLWRLQDRVERPLWRLSKFGGYAGEWLLLVPVSQDHRVYVWDHAARCLYRILSGPNEPCLGIAWHPTQPIMYSIGSLGSVIRWLPEAMPMQWTALVANVVAIKDNIPCVDAGDDCIPSLEELREQRERRLKDESRTILNLLT